MTVVVFLDTMLFLHYRPLAEIDWRAALGAETVRIVVPQITIRELDKHKNSHPSATLQRRAGAVLRQLLAGHEAALAGRPTSADASGEVWTPRVTVRDHVTVELQGLTTPFDYPAARLDPTINDDVLVASMLSWRADHPETSLVLVSADAGPRVTAMAFGLGVLEPLEAWRLPATLDPERRELEALRAENVRLKSAHPALRVVFAHTDAAEPEMCLAVKDAGSAVEPREEWAAASVAQARTVPELLPPEKPTTSPSSSARHFYDIYATQPPSPAEYARYADERRAYLSAFDVYLRDRWAYEARSARMVDLALVVANSGTAVADDVEVHVTVPAPMVIHDPEMIALFRRAPEPPRPPIPPQTLHDQARRGMNPFGGLSAAYTSHQIAFAPRTPPNAVDATDYAEGTRTFVWHVQRVKHGVDVVLPVVTVAWPDGVPVAPIGLDVTVHAANLPTAVRSALHLRVMPVETS